MQTGRLPWIQTIIVLLNFSFNLASHTQEKGYGAPAKKKATENKSAPEQTENAEKSAKPNAANDRSKHYHPRDGK